MPGETPNSEDPIVNRRTVLKATAVSTTGALAFTGTAAAEGPKLMQVNFCGCSQVCVVREDDDGDESFSNNEDDQTDSMGPITVIKARETDSGWEFDNIIYGNTGYFCDDSGESGDWKLIGVYAGREDPFPDDPACFVCNPTQCAAKALDEYLDHATKADCINGDPPEFGEFSASCNNRPYRFKVVRGRCGTPGKDSRGKEGRGRKGRRGRG